MSVQGPLGNFGCWPDPLRQYGSLGNHIRRLGKSSQRAEGGWTQLGVVPALLDNARHVVDQQIADAQFMSILKATEVADAQLEPR